MDSFAHEAYRVARKLPKEEEFGLKSQLRRAALSVPLNYIEGYARGKHTKYYDQFLNNAYSSLKEAKYCVHFSYKEDFLSQSDYTSITEQADEIGAMLWSTIRHQRVDKHS